jgi:hypothetical protein
MVEVGAGLVSSGARARRGSSAQGAAAGRRQERVLGCGENVEKTVRWQGRTGSVWRGAISLTSPSCTAIWERGAPSELGLDRTHQPILRAGPRAVHWLPPESFTHSVSVQVPCVLDGDGDGTVFTQSWSCPHRTGRISPSPCRAYTRPTHRGPADLEARAACRAVQGPSTQCVPRARGGCGGLGMRRRWVVCLWCISLSMEGATDRLYIRDEGEMSGSSWSSMVWPG